MVLRVETGEVIHTPLGGAQDIGNSSYLYEFSRGCSVLVDAGVRFFDLHNRSLTEEDFRRNYLPEFGKARNVKHIFITHAHLDHSAGLVIAAMQFRGATVYMTEATRDYSMLRLPSYARQLREFSWFESSSLYFNEWDAERVLEKAHIVSAGEELRLEPELQARVYHAEHIQGAVSLVFVHRGKAIVHTGDFSTGGQMFVPPLDYFKVPEEVVLLGSESTNIGVTARTREAEFERMFSRIEEFITHSGEVVILPVLPIGRGAELWMRMRYRAIEGGIIPLGNVYIDGSLKPYFTLAQKHGGGNAHMLRWANYVSDGTSGARWSKDIERRALLKEKKPLIIIASGAMFQEGSIAYHWAAEIAQEKRTELLFSNYLVPDSPGRAFVEGELADMPPHFSRIAFDRFGLSGHASREGIEEMEARLSPRVVAYHHGEPAQVVPYLKERNRHGVSGAKLLYPWQGRRVTVKW